MQGIDKPSARDLVNAIESFHQAHLQHGQQLVQLANLARKCAETTEQSNLGGVWRPSADFSTARLDGFLEFEHSVRKISRPQKPPEEAVDRLKTTWLGRAYVAHLKRHRFFFWLVNWIWARTYLPYLRFVSVHLKRGTDKKWLPLTRHGDLASTRGITVYKLIDHAVVETPAPIVFPASSQGYVVAQTSRYSFPPINVAAIGPAMLHGGTNLVLTEDKVVCHDLYDFTRDYTSEELHGRTLIDPSKNRIRWLLHDNSPERLPTAATFLDACAPNYAHWLTEVLPRIAAFCADERFEGIAIVVNEGLHRNIMESLFLVAGREREIIALPIGKALVVKNLYLTSVTGYVPFEPRTRDLISRSHGLFSTDALAILKRSLNEFQSDQDNFVWPQKIFLRRNSCSRALENGSEIETLLLSRGYVIVEPENLTFLEQIQVFSNAKIIIGATGAALTNGIFCRPDTVIIILIAKNKELLYKYWVNMLCPLGIKLIYVLGDYEVVHEGKIHGNFRIEPFSIIDALETTECR